jgi:hypothetical protein
LTPDTRGNDREGTLIRHAWLHLTQAAPVRPLAIAMIEPSFGAPLVAPVGGPSLLPAGLFAARDAAVAVSAITVRADEENRVAPLTKANFCRRTASPWATAMRHRRRGLDNGSGLVAG